jgi:hypothetical protein
VAPEERRTMKYHINGGSSPFSVFLLYFAEIITLLVMETNCYYHVYIDRLDLSGDCSSEKWAEALFCCEFYHPKSCLDKNENDMMRIFHIRVISFTVVY